MTVLFVRVRRVAVLALCAVLWSAYAGAPTDPLPSWNDGSAKQAIAKLPMDDPFKLLAGTLLFLNDNNAAKPEGIHLMIGRRPSAAVGNSTGDRQMREYSRAGGGERLAMLGLHDDDRREYAYGPARGLPDTTVGTFTEALYDEATKQGGVVVSMKSDRKTIFAFE